MLESNPKIRNSVGRDDQDITRDELEQLAESDLPCAPIAEAYLRVLEGDRNE